MTRRLSRVLAAGLVVHAVAALVACSSSATSSFYCSVSLSGTPDCYGFGPLTSDELASEEQVCASEMGVVVSACPAGYVGVCTTNTGGFQTQQFYYFGTASELRTACSGTWMSGTGDGGQS